MLLQRTNPAKYKALMAMESHLEERRGTEEWAKTQENVVGVMKKTLGVMVFEALYPEMDFSDETIQKIQGILDQETRVLIIFEAKPRDTCYDDVLETIGAMSKVVDRLYITAQKLT